MVSFLHELLRCFRFPSWIVVICIFCSTFLENSLLQKLHLNGFFPSRTTLMFPFPLMNCSNMYLLFYFFRKHFITKITLEWFLSLIITSMCEFKAHFFIKSAPHLSHLNCFRRVYFLHEKRQCVTLNYFPIKRASHLNGFCPSWTKSRLLFDPKLSTQILNLKGFLPSFHYDEVVIKRDFLKILT